MHMADALLSPAVGGIFAAGTIGAIAYSAKKLSGRLDDKLVPLMGVLGAFVFAAQMINFTIPGTGSSGHIGGGMLLAILLGPYPAFLVIASVLVIQAFFFADGGLLALGATIWNLGIYPCFLAYPLIYRPIAGDGKTPLRVITASVLSVVVGLELGAFSVALQTTLSGITELPFGTFVLLMLSIHLPIGIIEGLATAGVVSYFRTLAPGILQDIENRKTLPGEVPSTKVLIVFAVLTVLTGGVLSWFASAYPDGLEWAIERILGKPEVTERHDVIKENLAKVQEKTALFPDYNFPQEAEPKDPAPNQGEVETDTAATEEEESPWPAVDAGTSVSGLVGSVMVLALIVLLGLGIKLGRKKFSTAR